MQNLHPLSRSHANLAAAVLLGLLLPVVTAHAININVKEAGAKGDGVADDGPAIREAVAKITAAKGGRLHFPAGQYRIGAPVYGAVHFQGVSGVQIDFEPGAVLLMDNLLKDGKGGGHGIVFTGPAHDIGIHNATVEWRKRPASRGRGDGFRFEGFPSDDQTIEGITLVNCTTRDSAQTGAVFMGCSDVMVANFRALHTWADGLHFNACRRVNVNGYTGIDNGDDALAFVTYYAETLSGKTGGVFALPELGEWSNSASNAVNIVARGGRANGMRVSGGFNINVSNISVRDKWAGIQVDSAMKTETGRAVGWSYLASRSINISNAAIHGCSQGFIVRVLNIPPDRDPEFWLFSLNARNLSITGCRELGVNVQSAGGVMMDGLQTDSKIRFLNARGRYHLANAVLTGADIELKGVQGEKFSGFANNMEPLPVEVERAAEVAPGDFVLSRLAIRSGNLRVDGVAGLEAAHVDVRSGSVEVTRSRDSRFDMLTLTAEKPDDSPLMLRDADGVEFVRSRVKRPGKTEEITGGGPR